MKKSVLTEMCVALSITLCAGSALAGERYSVEIRSAADGEPAAVAILTQEEFAEVSRAGQMPRQVRARMRMHASRGLEVTAAAGDPAQAGHVELVDGQRIVLCVIGPELSQARSLHLALWSRRADSTGPQHTVFQKLYPIGGAESLEVGNDELVCIGQPGDGFNVTARYDQDGAREQVYAHYTSSAEEQMGADDVVVYRKDVGGSSRAAPGKYWSAQASYSVRKQ